MVLSIGMIVRDGEKYLEQCLTALQPIFKELDSELIIVDTGSVDNTVEIAKKFTDNVFFFEWINDFSAARNASLERAQGEWFMYIDQDEVAIDCTGLIKFFKSGEYKKYNSAAYVQRNLQNLDDTTRYTDFRQIVAVKREKDTRFINEFHEVLNPILKPTKYLDFIVMHYGMAFAGEEGEEFARAKSERNLKGLLDELEHTEGEPRVNIYKQIADCYMVIDEDETALKYLDIGMEKMDRHNAGVSIMFYTSKIQIYWNLQRFEETIALVDEYLDIEKNPFHTKDFSSDCQIRMIKAMACYVLDRCREAISEFVKVFELYRRYNEGKLLTEELTTTSWVVYDRDIKKCYTSFFGCCLTEKEYELAEKYASAMPLEKFFEDEEFMETYIRVRITLMKYNGFNGFGELYSRLDARNKEYLRRIIFFVKSDERETMIKKLYALGGMAKEIAEIHRAASIDQKLDIERISALLKKHGSENAHDILYLLLKCDVDVTPFVTAEDFSPGNTVRTMEALFKNSIKLFEAYDVEKVSPDGIIGAIRLYGALLPRVLEKELPISALFENYAKLGLQWKNSFEITSQVPDDVFAALYASVAFLAKHSNDRGAFTKGIADFKKLAPTLEEPANAYVWESEGSFTAQTPQTELDKLAAKVKQDIRNLLATGKLTDAKNLLSEFKSICPNDPDISAIAGKLGEA